MESLAFLISCTFHQWWFWQWDMRHPSSSDSPQAAFWSHWVIFPTLRVLESLKPHVWSTVINKMITATANCLSVNLFLLPTVTFIFNYFKNCQLLPQVTFSNRRQITMLWVILLIKVSRLQLPPSAPPQNDITGQLQFNHDSFQFRNDPYFRSTFLDATATSVTWNNVSFPLMSSLWANQVTLFLMSSPECKQWVCPLAINANSGLCLYFAIASLHKHTFYLSTSDKLNQCYNC